MGEMIKFASKKLLLTKEEVDLLRDAVGRAVYQRQHMLDNELKEDNIVFGHELRLMLREQAEQEIEVLDGIYTKLENA